MAKVPPQFLKKSKSKGNAAAKKHIVKQHKKHNADMPMQATMTGATSKKGY
jgi:hypothetical protein